MVNPSKEQLQLFNQHFEIKRKYVKQTTYELNKLWDYHFEYETFQSIENDYRKAFYGNCVLENRDSIYHRKSKQKVKDVITTNDIIQFIEQEMETQLKEHGQTLI